MTILKNCELWHAKLDPQRPNASFNKQNPSWELQLRTTSIEQRDEWKAEHLSPKLMTYKEGHAQEGEAILTEDGKRQWRVNLRKKSLNREGKASEPVSVIDAKLNPIDPRTIGNGSIGNVRLFQYEYVNEAKKGIASVLMEVQLKKHIVYERKPGESFEEDGETETIIPPPQQHEEGKTSSDAPQEAKSPSTAPSPKPVDERPPEAF
jgi:hypothetical protein